jgi:SPP1 gp7 family putative phage head morphogenesis protein
MLNLTEEEIELYLLRVHLGIITVNSLPVNVYNAIVELLTDGIIAGFGGDVTAFEFGSRQEFAMRLYKQNTQIFSAAKTYQQVVSMTDGLFDSNNKIVPFSEFKKVGLEVYEKYNVNWLQAEYQTAILQAEGARQWLDIEENKQVLPYLQYVTIGDDRVRQAHKERDGITRPVDDSFWDANFPPIGWRCFTPETNVLTPKGWIQIKDINIGDKVIGGSGKAKNVDFVHINKFKGDLVVLGSKEIRLTSTENHRILTFDGWIQAKNINIGDVVVQHVEIGFLNKIICAINNVYVLCKYIFMPLFSKRDSAMRNTFNGQ